MSPSRPKSVRTVSSKFTLAEKRQSLISMKALIEDDPSISRGAKPKLLRQLEELFPGLGAGGGRAARGTPGAKDDQSPAPPRS